MKRLALTALALASTALSGAAFANDYYDQGAYRPSFEYSQGYANNYNDNDVRYDTARVISVDPIIDEQYAQAHRECWVQPARNNNRFDNSGLNSAYVNSYDSRGYSAGYSDIGNNHNQGINDYSRRNNGIGNNTSAVLGGVLGAAIGNQVGEGDGRRAATAVGAILGYAIARDLQKDHRSDNRYAQNSYDNTYGYQSDGQSYGQSYGYSTEPNGRLRCRMVNDGRYDYGYSQSSYGAYGGNAVNSYGNNPYSRDQYINERYQDRYNHDRYDNRYDNARVTGYRVTFEYHGANYTTTTDYHPGNNIRVRVNVEADGSRQVGSNDRYESERYARY